MNISEDKILEIKRAADIHAVVSEYVALKKAGKDYVGLCPFHDEKTASFTVSTEKQMYFCFGCGTAGDVFEFLMKKNGMSFLEAAKLLAARYGITLPEGGAPVTYHGTPKPPRLHSASPGFAGKDVSTNSPPGRGGREADGVCNPSDNQYPSPPDLWQEKAAALVTWAHEKLLANSEQLKILAARGIKIETVKHFRLGWNPGKDDKDLFRPRESWGLPTEMKDGRKKKLWLPIGLVIPMFVHGHVHRLRIRRPGGNKPTYYIIPGSSMATWVMPSENNSPPGRGGRDLPRQCASTAGAGGVCRVFVIVESELDGILLWQEARDITGIISVGSSSTRPDLAAIKLLQKSSWILNALDFDQAGAKALEWWTNHFSQHHRWPVPAGKDPGEAWQAGIDLKEWIISGFPSGWRACPPGVRRNGQSSFDSDKKTTQKFTGIEVKYGDVVTGQNKKGVDVFQGRAEAGERAKVQPQGHTGSLPVDISPLPTDSQPLHCHCEKRSDEAISMKLATLEKLLKQYPVTISSTKERVYLREAMSWVNKNPEASKEISNLVFMTSDVFEYICNHPARIITGDNLII